MQYENIVFEEDENVRIIKFNRPKALNAINPPTLTEVRDALGRVEEDSSARALVFTGAGEKAFVAGADISHMAKLTSELVMCCMYLEQILPWKIPEEKWASDLIQMCNFLPLHHLKN